MFIFERIYNIGNVYKRVCFIVVVVDAEAARRSCIRNLITATEQLNDIESTVSRCNNEKRAIYPIAKFWSPALARDTCGN